MPTCVLAQPWATPATQARERLKTVMEQDWDQTVRSRAREALERMRE
ncbi:hypothetical protein [Candidatus Nitrospira nitrificans]|nr:hypothetical protein [Candidatus Nitrospira nitrificans]